MKAFILVIFFLLISTEAAATKQCPRFTKQSSEYCKNRALERKEAKRKKIHAIIDKLDEEFEKLPFDEKKK